MDSCQTNFCTTDSRQTRFYDRRFRGLDIAIINPNMCFVCVILFLPYLVIGISER